MSGPSPSRALTHIIGATCCAVMLFWWVGIDRLDAPKLGVLSVGALALVVGLLWDARGPFQLDAISASCAGLVLIALIAAPEEMAARVEGWAGWMAALVIVRATRQADPEGLRRWLPGGLTALLMTVWLQALGAPLLNTALSFRGRLVVGTLGNPGHLGWVLAALLPWVGENLPPGGWSRRRRIALLALCVGGLVLSGSRVAWVMAVAGAPLWLQRASWRPIAGGLIVGALVAVGVDTWTDAAHLGARMADLGDASGSARGRLYLWRVYAETAGQWFGAGAGPEGFQRVWPSLQGAFLVAHPDLELFRSDLRHAHFDAVEIAIDLGPVGLVASLWLLVRVFIPRPEARAARRSAASASLASLLVGGLAAPIISFAPLLALAAVSVGLRLGPVETRSSKGWRRALSAPLLLVLIASSVLLSRRLRSETARSAATHARVGGALNRTEAARATQLDPRNPRAWIELALTCRVVGDRGCARRALQEAVQDLPSDGVRRALYEASSTPGAP